jgi:hypothetical protein
MSNRRPNATIITISVADNGFVSWCNNIGAGGDLLVEMARAISALRQVEAQLQENRLRVMDAREGSDGRTT